MYKLLPKALNIRIFTCSSYMSLTSRLYTLFISTLLTRRIYYVSYLLVIYVTYLYVVYVLVGYKLVFRHYNFPTFLEYVLVCPLGINSPQVISYSVMLPQKQGVQGSQLRDCVCTSFSYKREL